MQYCTKLYYKQYSTKLYAAHYNPPKYSILNYIIVVTTLNCSTLKYTVLYIAAH